MDTMDTMEAIMAVIMAVTMAVTMAVIMADIMAGIMAVIMAGIMAGIMAVIMAVIMGATMAVIMAGSMGCMDTDDSKAAIKRRKPAGSLAGRLFAKSSRRIAGGTAAGPGFPGVIE
ncbi:hypothetical protein ACP26L_09235 [Paenibacillus sp. S-38]|uniref:hypothetical protein n=1 Tax=Paenibacillus sp. S-38 TaxID=3416710 RepID=UPI003CF6749C